MDKHTDNPEKKLARRVAEALELGLNGMATDKLDRLRAARVAAVAAYREPSPVGALMTTAGQKFDVRSWMRRPLMLISLVVVALVLAVGTYQTLNQEDLSDDAGAVDAELLASETPIDALLDNDFATWVQESSQK